MEQPTKYWLNNVAGTAQLVDALLGAGVDQIVFSSSCSVNGTPAHDARHRGGADRARSRCTPRRRRWSSRSSAGTASRSGLRAVSLRYFNAAGASADGRFGEVWDRSINLVPVAMKAALGRRPPLQVFGDDYPTPDGTCIRDYIHVDDLADAHVKALGYLAGGGATVVAQRRHRRRQQRARGPPRHRAGRRPARPHEFAPRRAGDPGGHLRRSDAHRRDPRLAGHQGPRRHRRHRRGRGTARTSMATPAPEPDRRPSEPAHVARRPSSSATARRRRSARSAPTTPPRSPRSTTASRPRASTAATSRPSRS